MRDAFARALNNFTRAPGALFRKVKTGKSGVQLLITPAHRRRSKADPVCPLCHLPIAEGDDVSFIEPLRRKKRAQYRATTAKPNRPARWMACCRPRCFDRKGCSRPCDGTWKGNLPHDPARRKNVVLIRFDPQRPKAFAEITGKPILVGSGIRSDCLELV